jgi:hypothetical protein
MKKRNEDVDVFWMITSLLAVDFHANKNKKKCLGNSQFQFEFYFFRGSKKQCFELYYQFLDNVFLFGFKRNELIILRSIEFFQNDGELN